MTAQSHYHFCNRNIGKPVRIVEKGGRVHLGVIERVNPNYVFIKPLRGPGGPGGLAWGWWGPGLGVGLAFGVALGAIATIGFWGFW